MKYVQAKIGDYKSHDDFGLVLMKISITDPEAKTHIVEVPGRRVALDMTEYLYGRITYKPRILTLTFDHFHRGFEPWHTLCSRLLTAWHGRRLKITLDTDPYFYWIGRVSVTSEKESPLYASVVVTAEVEPYKYGTENFLTRWRWDSLSFSNGVIREYGLMQIPDSKKLTIIGSPEPVTPRVKASQAMTVTVGGKSWQLSSEQWKELTGLKLGREPTEFIFSETGIVSVDFKEESL